MKLEGSLPCSQNPELDLSSPHLPTLLLSDQFEYISSHLLLNIPSVLFPLVLMAKFFMNFSCVLQALPISFTYLINLTITGEAFNL
jgi:hypothetical protein